jgi:hypothetical protein
MKNARLNSKSDLGAMSPARRLPLPQRSERDFLSDQAVDARTAAIQTLHEMKHTLTRAADMRSRAKEHPWLVIAVAVAAGFAAGAVLTRSPRKKSDRRAPKSEAECRPTCQGQPPPQTKRSFLFATAWTFVVSILQNAVRSWIAAAVVGREQPPIETLSPHDSMAADARESRSGLKV